MKKMCTILLFIILFLFLMGCSSKRNPISMQEFETIIRKKNYNYTNIKDHYLEDSTIQDAGIAYTSVWQVEFYILDTEENAIKMYDDNQSNYEDLKDTIHTYSLDEHSYKNGDTYSLITNKDYLYISRIDNTVIFTYVPVEYYNKVHHFINELGY